MTITLCSVLLLGGLMFSVIPGIAPVTGIAPNHQESVPIPKQTFIYKQAGDLSIKADVYRPADESIRPAILWIHGGALIAGDRNDIRRDQLVSYLDAGFAVVSIDYRLAPETKLPGIIDDLRDAYRWLRKEGPKSFKIDPDRVAVVGHSAGGYLTLMAGFCLNPRPRALVSFYGYGDIVGAWYSRPDPFYSRQPAVSKEEAYSVVGHKPIVLENDAPERYRFYLYCRQNGLWPREVGGRDPDKDPRFFKRYCPIRNVTKDYPPTLLLHSDQDTDVPHAQSVEMAQELARNRVPYELITMEGLGHGFDRDRARNPKVAAAFDRVLAFLKQNLHQKPQSP